MGIAGTGFGIISGKGFSAVPSSGVLLSASDALRLPAGDLNVPVCLVIRSSIVENESCSQALH
jgi:hypothetical protein